MASFSQELSNDFEGFIDPAPRGSRLVGVNLAGILAYFAL
jgi:hypothetical protein